MRKVRQNASVHVWLQFQTSMPTLVLCIGAVLFSPRKPKPKSLSRKRPQSPLLCCSSASPNLLDRLNPIKRCLSSRGIQTLPMQWFDLAIVCTYDQLAHQHMGFSVRDGPSDVMRACRGLGLDCNIPRRSFHKRTNIASRLM
jgi:hypothetical protein